MDPNKNQNTAKSPEGKQQGEKTCTGGSVLTMTLSARSGGVSGVTTVNPANSASNVCPEVVGGDSRRNPQPSAGGSKGETSQVRQSERSKEDKGGGPELLAPIAVEHAAQTPVSSVSETKPMTKPRPLGNSRRESAKDRGRVEVDGQASAKKVRPNETSSSHVDPKKQKLNQTRDTRLLPHEAVVQASESTEIAITSSTHRFISRETATKVEDFILANIDKMANLATCSSASEGPMFRGRPTYMDGSLRLICENEKTVQWVKKCLEEFEHPEQIIVLGPGEIPRRVHIGVLLPGLETDSTLVKNRLLISNPWADLRSWMVNSMQLKENHSTFMVFTIPEEQRIKIIARERRLCYRLGSVYVKLRDSKGRYVTTTPSNEDTSRQKEVSTSTPQKPGPEPGEEASTSTQPVVTAPVVNMVQLEEEELAGVEMELGGEECQDGVFLID